MDEGVKMRGNFKLRGQDELEESFCFVLALVIPCVHGCDCAGKQLGIGGFMF